MAGLLGPASAESGGDSHGEHRPPPNLLQLRHVQAAYDILGKDISDSDLRLLWSLVFIGAPKVLVQLMWLVLGTGCPQTFNFVEYFSGTEAI
eukprot:609459-Alexandrium_andersonii.AAC.1